MNRSYIVGIVVGAIVVVLLFPPVRPFFVVGEWQQSIVTQFGKFKRAVREPGLHWKTPLVEDVTMYERRILASDAQPRDYLTLDKKRVVVDHVDPVADQRSFPVLQDRADRATGTVAAGRHRVLRVAPGAGVAELRRYHRGPA